MDYKRQELLFNPEEHQCRVSVVGLGNIGSHTAITLARLGVQSLKLYDPDKVEEHNLTSQAYQAEDIGRPKVHALTEKIVRVNPSLLVSSSSSKFKGNETDFMSSVLVIAVDSMKERENICKEMIKSKFEAPLIIDGRVGGEQLEIYSCSSLDEWKKTFVKHPSHDPCGGRYICYVSVVIAALITNQIKKFLKGETLDKAIMMNVNSLEIIKNFKW